MSRSPTSALPSGRNAIPHGVVRPDATTPVTLADGAAAVVVDGLGLGEVAGVEAGGALLVDGAGALDDEHPVATVAAIVADTATATSPPVRGLMA